MKSIIAESIKATGTKEEHTIDCPAIPITHVFVEFQNMKIRDRFVRSANMRKYELDRPFWLKDLAQDEIILRDVVLLRCPARLLIRWDKAEESGPKC